MKNIATPFFFVILLLGSLLTSCSLQDQEEVLPLAEAKNTADKLGGFYPEIIVRGSLNGLAADSVTWSSDTVWVINGPVYINAGQVLTIEPGTVVKGFFGSGSRAATLIVARGGKIMAEGTQDAPIIFTSILDPITPGETFSVAGLPPGIRGLWGGITLMGNAPVGMNNVGGFNFVEGLLPNDARHLYGGMDEDDNSGILKYVSIRYAGSQIGAGNEINGLTMAGVGRGTQIEFVEVIACRDDAFQWFGGTVNTKYLVAAFCGDDAFDYDAGYQGKGQFWYAWQAITGDRGIEAKNFYLSDRNSQAQVINATFRGNSYLNPFPSNRIASVLNGSELTLYRSVFTNYDQTFELDSLSNFTFQDNLFYKVQTDSNFRQVGLMQDLVQVADSVDTLFVQGLVPHAEVGLRDTFLSEMLAAGDTLFVLDSFFEDTNYVGAFQPETSPWTSGWTMLSYTLIFPATDYGAITLTEPEDPNAY